MYEKIKKTTDKKRKTKTYEKEKHTKEKQAYEKPIYEKLRITENTLQVLSLFTGGFRREYYVREVEKLLRISPRTSQLVLEDLESRGVLESKTRGKIKTYKVRPGAFARRYLVFAEQYKAIAFLEKRPMIKEIVDKITPHVRGIGIIFGSYAKGLEKEDSDLDIFAAGSCDAAGIKKVSVNLGIEISVKNYPISTFRKNLNRDILLREILKNHIVFSGAEQFIEAAFRDE
ncbi:MAG: nucleotidyltransferase domain-containing protein [Candidatus Aenigmarchaeota archaeon]|nr:nucleotidyltransferase domain-containing protein [Candidatus Aenigmarchaeota archaeon]